MNLDILLQDLNYTIRTLGRDRGFTISPFSFWPWASAPTSRSLA